MSKLLSNKKIASLLQFINAGGSCAWLRYQDAYFSYLMLTHEQIAVVAPFVAMMEVFGCFFWSYLTDLSNQFRLVYTMSAILGFILLTLYFINFTKEVMVGYLPFLYVVKSLKSFCFTSWDLTDVVTLQLIDDKITYGKYRVWATIGWGISSLILGYIIVYIGYYSILVWEFIGFVLMLLIVNIFVPDEMDGDVKLTDDIETNKDYFTILKERLVGIGTDINFIACIILGCLHNIVMSIINIATFTQFKEEYNISNITLGVFVFISTLSEIPCFYFGHYILKYFKPNATILFSHTIIFIRLIIHALIDARHVNLIYFLQLLHGFCIALPTITIRVYLNRKATANSSKYVNLTTTIQSLLGTPISILYAFAPFVWSKISSFRYVYYAGCIALIPSILLMFIVSILKKEVLFNENINPVDPVKMVEHQLADVIDDKKL